MRRALLLIGEGPDLPTSCGAHGDPMPQTMVSVSIEFDREAFAWKAFDEVGNVVHADEGVLAILRCLEKRLAFPRDKPT